MRKKIWVLLIPIGLCLFCVSVNLLVDKSSIGSHPIDHLEDLLVDAEDFPAGWKLNYIQPIKGSFDYGKENVSEGFELDEEQGFAHQYVYQFSNAYSAVYGHYLLNKDLLVVRESLIDFSAYQSRVANDWYIGCIRTDPGGVGCTALGRYEDYVVYFFIDAGPDRLTAVQLEKILQSIDARMARHLRK